MKKQLLKALSISLLIPILFSSCEMAQSRDGLSGLADGAKVPAALAIASGNPVIMLECLDGLRSQLNEGGLSVSERGEVALDMIDLIAVISDVIIKLAPYLVGELDPATITNINDFFDSADLVSLQLIAQERLMEAGILADPAPLQLFWSLLSLASLAGFDYDNLTDEQKALFPIIIAEANAQAAEGTNTSFQPLLDHFQSELGW